MRRRFLYVMDPMTKVLVDKDTTFAFQLEGARRGYEQYHCLPDDLFVTEARPHASVRRVVVQRGTPHFTLHELRTVPLDFFDVVFMRKDPPFDMAYFFATHLLGLCDRTRTLVVNDPRGLREANEKLYALNFPDIIPPSIVTSDAERLKTFMHELGGEMILKPLDGAGGAGVFHLHAGDRNLNAILENSTRDGTRLVMGQRYLPAARAGDKRVIVLAGEPIGAVLRIPREDEHRGNIHVGGRVERAAVDARDREICRRLAPRLAADGLYFVGLDVIDGLVTEINVTSPTGVQEIDRFDGVCLEAQVLDFVEQKAAALDRSGAPH
ncbi:MAG TPA: glutathione synthase [Candidatus Limnocylindria bacterium]|nr:glutathione synthase [Candidatus Limnocylindria bacterium]